MITKVLIDGSSKGSSLQNQKLEENYTRKKKGKRIKVYRSLSDIGLFVQLDIGHFFEGHFVLRKNGLLHKLLHDNGMTSPVIHVHELKWEEEVV